MNVCTFITVLLVSEFWIRFLCVWFRPDDKVNNWMTVRRKKIKKDNTDTIRAEFETFLCERKISLVRKEVKYRNERKRKEKSVYARRQRNTFSSSGDSFFQWEEFDIALHRLLPSFCVKLCSFSFHFAIFGFVLSSSLVFFFVHLFVILVCDVLVCAKSDSIRHIVSFQFDHLFEQERATSASVMR